MTWRNKSSSPQAILDYMRVLNGYGLTMVYDVGRPSEGQLAPLEDLAASQALPLRVFHTLRYSATDEDSTNEALELINGDAQPFSNDLQFGLLGLGEHIYVPVLDNPNRRDRWDNEAWGPFSEISYAAARNGWSVHEHIMSQVTAVQFLDLIEEIAAEVPTVSDLHWTLAHVNGMQEEDIERAAKLGVAFAVHSQARMSVRAIDAPRMGSISRSGRCGDWDLMQELLRLRIRSGHWNGPFREPMCGVAKGGQKISASHAKTPCVRIRSTTPK